MSDEKSLLSRLKQRHVFRVGGMYLVAAWVLLQFAEIMIDFMALPDWTGRALIVLVSLGFPFILLLAWVFDVSTNGVRADATSAGASDQQGALRKIDSAIVFMVLLGAGLAFYLWPSEAPDATGEPEVMLHSPVIEQQNSNKAHHSDKYILVGNLVDFTGASGSSGQAYGQAIIDANNWINENGGINGKLIDLDTIETSYQVRRAVDAYEKWSSQGVVAIQGWGTAIGVALKDDINADQVPFFSASYSAEFTDPQGIKTGDAAPYNFFYGPSYSDGCRGLVQWADSDWRTQGKKMKPKYLHMGDNQPYPNAPKAACEAYAAELGFEVLQPIIFSMIPGDYSRQCRLLKASAPDYVFLANLDKSVSALLTQCSDLEVDTQYMANIYGFDEDVMLSAGSAANGLVWVMGAAAWGDSASGMYTVREISKMSDPQESKYRSVHYMRGVCSTFYLKEAIEIANEKNTMNSAAIKQALYAQAQWVPKGLEGVCLPTTWTEKDHRGVTKVPIYQARVNGPVTGLSIQSLINNQIIEMTPIYEATIERKPEWLGW